MTNVTKATRVKRSVGWIRIYCPHCKQPTRFSTLAWTEAQCTKCPESVPKFDWLLEVIEDRLHQDAPGDTKK